MNDGLSIRGRYLKGERITITSGRHQFLAFTFFMLGFIMLVSASWMILAIDEFSSLTIGIIVTLYVLSFIFTYNSLLIIDLGIKKDTVFISHFFTSSRIIGIEEIKRVRTFKVLGINMIYIVYSCQKKCRKCLFIQNSKRNNLKKIQLLIDEYEKATHQRRA